MIVHHAFVFSNPFLALLYSTEIVQTLDWPAPQILKAQIDFLTRKQLQRTIKKKKQIKQKKQNKRKITSHKKIKWELKNTEN